MKVRAVASIALAAAVAAGLAGCNLISPQRTTLAYNASDGVGLSLGGVELRNALFISDGAEADRTARRASLVVAVVNGTGRAGELKLSVQSPDGGKTVSAALPYTEADEVQPVGYGEGEILWVEGLDFHPGGAVNLTVTAPDGASQTVLVPVLDTHGLPEYATLLPDAGHHHTPHATGTATPEPAETEAPQEQGEEG